MKDLTYEETIELEANVKIKKEADQIYSDFLKYCMLSPGTFKDKKFKIWSDSHNATYLAVTESGFEYQCRFLHETYNLAVSPAAIFSAMKSKYRGVEHFVSWIEGLKKF